MWTHGESKRLFFSLSHELKQETEKLSALSARVILLLTFLFYIFSSFGCFFAELRFEPNTTENVMSQLHPFQIDISDNVFLAFNDMEASLVEGVRMKISLSFLSRLITRVYSWDDVVDEEQKSIYHELKNCRNKQLLEMKKKCLSLIPAILLFRTCGNSR